MRVKLSKYININELHDLLNNTEIMKGTRRSTFLHFDDVKRPKHEMFSIVSNDKCCLGFVSLSEIDTTHRSAEFSIMIDPKRKGQGYGEDALKEILKYGFKCLNLHRIWGETFDYNIGAQKLFEKVGFLNEGRSKKAYYKNGEYVDSIHYAMLKENFKEFEWSALAFCYQV